MLNNILQYLGKSVRVTVEHTILVAFYVEVGVL